MKSKFHHTTLTAVVIANMIGTGVFTSLGFQLLEIQSGFAILMLWALGGGEYNFLTKIYHPCAGFVSGWVSATIGFSAPTALAAITFSSYLMSIFPEADTDWTRKAIACTLIIILA